MPCRVVAPLLLVVMVVVVVMVVDGAEMSVYQGSGLPEDSVSMTLSSTNLCGCRVRCSVMPSCTAVTATPDEGGFSCGLSTSTSPESKLTVATSSTTFVKASQLSGSSNLEYFLSTEKNNDGSFVSYYCTKENGFPASLSTFDSLTALKIADQMDGITDINDMGIWVEVSSEKTFYNKQSVDSARSGITLDTTEMGTCYRLKQNNVLATANCALMKGTVAYACAKFITTMSGK